MQPTSIHPNFDFREGALLLVNKPLQWTSFDVVNKIRYKIKHKLGVKKFKVGHAGTLDPLATGLLIICVGKFTKKLNDLQGLPKAYTGTLKLGATTASYDAEEPENNTFPTEHITPELIEEKRQLFVGDMEQYPPIYSAIKVDGQAMYKSARAGKKVDIKPRAVHLFDFNITKVDLPHLDFYAKCSKGTYIRSLAHDFGKALDSGAYLTGLRRTAVGEYHIDDAWNLDEFIQFLETI